MQAILTLVFIGMFLFVAYQGVEVSRNIMQDIDNDMYDANSKWKKTAILARMFYVFLIIMCTAVFAGLAFEFYSLYIIGDKPHVH